ncbi:1-deoxy-D-xylulose-5-phosphate reductoisomerase [Candidatus Pandoraea novymonadis]|uniref:1-deoxy-D-xylulose 5-phosphate reductoisomerase n=1 Tax=Candidatus Pandoraea novymonadis TaxID=1808959 RepID=A0ABX5FE87_9BURK|nr:1-deoxy-D-xylulose-5-phosphate reductoisomerase [Candidatus Pandoraea novymonadis]PSB92029.1 1-deoxy-D-xylulose 5-phosphate reductoisomerase [Candidatus Pandoraea novymonadis]
MKKHVVILGSTGSIGVNTLDVISRHPEQFKVHALSAHRNIDLLFKQCLIHRPSITVVENAVGADMLSKRLKKAGLSRTEVWHGPGALVEIACTTEADTVVAAIVGAAGLGSTMAAAKAGKRILLANKEALVLSGAIFMAAVERAGAMLLPLDSEHNAIFQCLPHQSSINTGIQPKMASVERLVLTASGGPFRDRKLSSLDKITPDEACAHPNWVMGRKISVDSANMMNKGLEVIEAYWLFGVPAERIEVLIHPQSVIHSMVSYTDGSMLAQLGNPDMRTPIAHALAFPERISSGVKQLNLAEIGKLTFEAPDMRYFPCLRLAFEALRNLGTSGALLNAANEIAVEAFLARRIRFTAIAEVVEYVLDTIPSGPALSMDDVLDADRRARAMANTRIVRLMSQSSS